MNSHLEVRCGAKDAFEVYTQKNAQIDYDAKKKELQNFYIE